MLIKLNKSELNQYIDFAYSLALDLTKSSYPTYVDGIKTKEHFIDAAKKAFNDDFEEILLFKKDELVLGWIQYYFIKADNYLAPYTFLAADYPEEMMEEFLKYIGDKYPGADVWMGFPSENTAVCQYLENQDFKLIEESYNQVLFLDNYQANETTLEVDRLIKNNYDDFKKLHDNCQSDMYWNSERIFKHFDKWHIYVYQKEGEVLGAIYYMAGKELFEVFGIDFLNNSFNEEVARSLLVYSLNDLKKKPIKHIVYFSDGLDLPILHALNFKLISKYRCFLKTI